MPSTTASNQGREYLPIRIFHWDQDEPLGYSVYLRLAVNDKFIKYFGDDTVLSDEHIARLRSKKTEELYIRSEDFDNYRKSVGSSIRNRLLEAKTENEKVDIIKMEASRIIEAVDTLSAGADTVQWVENCVELTKGILVVLSEEKLSTMFEKLQSLLEEKPTLMSHSLLVSSLSVIFAMSLGIHDNKQIEEIAIGGLLHDIGFYKCSPEIVEKSLEEKALTPEEMEEYRMHPQYGVDLLRGSKQLVHVSEEVFQIILNHHENEAAGFPKRIPVTKLRLPTKVVAIANRVSREIKHGAISNVREIVTKIRENQQRLPFPEFDRQVLERIQDAISNPEA